MTVCFIQLQLSWLSLSSPLFWTMSNLDFCFIVTLYRLGINRLETSSRVINPTLYATLRVNRPM